MKKATWKQPVARLIPAAWIKQYEQQQGRIQLISYPKCGRTWLRMMIGKALAEEFHLPMVNPLNLNEYHRYSGQIPRIKVGHDDKPHRKKPADIERDKQQYGRSKVIFLVRDPRDVITSLYYHMTYRLQASNGSISEFIRKEVGGIHSLITFYNIWAENQEQTAAFLLVRYEDLHQRPQEELKSIFNFMGVEVAAMSIEKAIMQSSFQNMREIEKAQSLSGVALRSVDPANEQSYKTRKGKTGSYRQDLQPEDIAFLNEVIAANLSDYYGYYKNPAFTHE
jgi:hypothetical protein